MKIRNHTIRNPEIVRWENKFIRPTVIRSDFFVGRWMEQADKLKNGEISKEEYDEWRYKYPELDTYQKRAKVPSQELSDYLVKELTKKEK